MSESPKAMALDASLYSIEPEAEEFLKSQTGIQSQEELKQHVMDVQAEAYAVHPYPCIRRFAFIYLKLRRLPAYKRLLTLGKERQGAILLDVGCCFGNDVRLAVADGFPIQGVIASDINPEFWDLGHKLFKSTPETFPVPFVAADALNEDDLGTVPPFYSAPSTAVPELSTLTSLNPLRGHVSAIHASSLFHLFKEEEQTKLARALAGLLSPEPGSMLLGAHGAHPEKGTISDVLSDTPRGWSMFCHSPESWAELWDGQVFEKGTVKVEASLVEMPKERMGPAPATGKFYFMNWSVTRL